MLPDINGINESKVCVGFGIFYIGCLLHGPDCTGTELARYSQIIHCLSNCNGFNVSLVDVGFSFSDTLLCTLFTRAEYKLHFVHSYVY